MILDDNIAQKDFIPAFLIRRGDLFGFEVELKKRSIEYKYSLLNQGFNGVGFIPNSVVSMENEAVQFLCKEEDVEYCKELYSNYRAYQAGDPVSNRGLYIIALILVGILISYLYIIDTLYY